MASKSLPSSFAEVLTAWPDLAALASDIGAPYPTVCSWKRRNAIPQAWWQSVILSARKHGLRRITHTLLETIESTRQQTRRHRMGHAAPAI